MNEVKDFISPELLNRIDYKIVFKPLDKETMINIFQKEIKEFLNVRSQRSELTLPTFSKKQIQKIIDEIYEPQYGARPITRYIHDSIEPQIIDQIMK
ncbi:MAG: ATP-dependent Clp protease ATP-binding subunit [bacterium]|nr:ATP-dependent Clp protease ATP-binding subunit [bacterium]